MSTFIAMRYVLSQVFKPLFAAMIIGLLLLLSERLVRLLDNALGKKDSFGLVFEMISYLIPHYLGLALPAAFFLGLLFGFNRLSKESELDAFLASGVSLHQVTKPVIGIAVLFSVLAVFIFSHVQPYARYAYRAVVHTATNVEIYFLAEEGVFMRTGQRTFIIDTLSRKDNKFRRLFLFQDKGTKGSETITARVGELIEIDGETRPVLSLENGHRQKIYGQPNIEKTGKPPRNDVGLFSRIDTPIGRLSNEVFRKRGKDYKELTLGELLSYQDKPPEDLPKKITKPSLIADFHRRIVSILSFLVLPFLALPFSLGRRRGQRPYRFAAALIVLIGYNEIISNGALAVRESGMSPYLGIWLPFGILVIVSLWRYYMACYRLQKDRLEPIYDKLEDAYLWLKSKVIKKAEAR